MRLYTKVQVLSLIEMHHSINKICVVLFQFQKSSLTAVIIFCTSEDVSMPPETSKQNNLLVQNGKSVEGIKESIKDIYIGR